MARKNSSSTIGELVQARLIELAIDTISKERLAKHLADVEDGRLAYLLNVPMFIPCKNEIVFIKNNGTKSNCIGIVENVNLPNSLVTVNYTYIDTYYFKTAELAENYAKTGKLPSYSEYDCSKSDTYNIKGQKRKKASDIFEMTMLEPTNCGEDPIVVFAEELKFLNED